MEIYKVKNDWQVANVIVYSSWYMALILKVPFNSGVFLISITLNGKKQTIFFNISGNKFKHKGAKCDTALFFLFFFSSG